MLLLWLLLWLSSLVLLLLSVDSFGGEPDSSVISERFVLRTVRVYEGRIKVCAVIEVGGGWAPGNEILPDGGEFGRAFALTTRCTEFVSESIRLTSSRPRDLGGDRGRIRIGSVSGPGPKDGLLVFNVSDKDPPTTDLSDLLSTSGLLLELNENGSSADTREVIEKGELIPAASGWDNQSSRSIGCC